MNQDQATQDYIALFDAAKSGFDAEVSRLSTLVDVARCPSSALVYHFLENGLVYPDFPEATDEIKRAILLNSESIHAKRYTVAGLSEYVGYFALLGVTVTVSDPPKRTLLLGVVDFGLPSKEMLESAVSGAVDESMYLYLQQPLTIHVSFGPGASDQMKEFFEKTLKYELPFGDDLASNVVLEFEEE